MYVFLLNESITSHVCSSTLLCFSLIRPQKVIGCTFSFNPNCRLRRWAAHKGWKLSYNLFICSDLTRKLTSLCCNLRMATIQCLLSIIVSSYKGEVLAFSMIKNATCNGSFAVFRSWLVEKQNLVLYLKQQHSF